KEDIHCSGYRGPYDQLWMYCRACEIRKCMEKKGIETCFNCVEFQNLGCRSFEEISAFAQDRGRISGRILSNFTRMNLAGSSSRIQNGGVRAAVGQSHGTNADVVTALVNCGK
ncbi:MAG: DUF3795 domain-containing protein, partial [Methanomassiliicoccales archaeon]|nr:DUF3795 domain-containing protein [Methanomassiliicoccales archaeon]